VNRFYFILRKLILTHQELSTLPKQVHDESVR